MLCKILHANEVWWLDLANFRHQHLLYLTIVLQAKQSSIEWIRQLQIRQILKTQLFVSNRGCNSLILWSVGITVNIVLSACMFLRLTILLYCFNNAYPNLGSKPYLAINGCRELDNSFATLFPCLFDVIWLDTTTIKASVPYGVCLSVNDFFSVTTVSFRIETSKISLVVFSFKRYFSSKACTHRNVTSILGHYTT